jgi:hypothetical protein
MCTSLESAPTIRDLIYRASFLYRSWDLEKHHSHIFSSSYHTTLVNLILHFRWTMFTFSFLLESQREDSQSNKASSNCMDNLFPSKQTVVNEYLMNRLSFKSVSVRSHWKSDLSFRFVLVIHFLQQLICKQAISQSATKNLHSHLRITTSPLDRGTSSVLKRLLLTWFDNKEVFAWEWKEVDSLSNPRRRYTHFKLCRSSECGPVDSTYGEAASTILWNPAPTGIALLPVDSVGK